MTAVALLWTFLLCFGMPAPALGATNYKVSTVSVSLKEGKVDPGVIYPVEVSCSSSKYEIREVSVSSEYEEWEVGRKVTYTIRLASRGDYYFSKSSTKLKASNGTVLSGSGITRNTIVMKVTYIPSITLEQPADIQFDEDDPYLATWEKVRHAHAYDVRIYRDGKKYKTITVTKPEIDIGKYATDGEDITFDVRAVPKNSTESKYLDPSKWTNCNDSVGSGSNSVYGNFTGDTDNYRFKSSDGSYASGWQLINGEWYYFDPANRNRGISSSWKEIQGKWYYFNQYCQMQTGWKKINGEWYYLWIVVAIIAILIAVSIPLVSTALEKAAKATDAANERSARAVATVSYLTDSFEWGDGDAYFYDIEKGILVEDEDTVSIYGKCSDHKGQYIKVEKNKDFDEKDAPEEPLFTIAWSNGGTTDNESLDSSELMTSEPTTTP